MATIKVEDKEIGSVTIGNRWLTYDGDKFTVYQRGYYAKKTTVVYEGRSEAEAVKALIGEEESTTHD